MDANNPHPEFNDPDRHSLIQQLDVLVHGVSVSTDAWAFIWLCDKAKLAHLIENFSISDRLVLRSNSLALNALAPWLITEGSSSSVTNTPQVSGSTSSRTPEGQRTSEETEPEPLQMSPPLLYTAGPSVERQPRVTHDRSLAGKVFQRDYNCIVTKSRLYVDGAHICPFSMTRYLSPQSTFWVCFRMFWADSEVAAWEKALQTDLGTEILANIITMGKTVHAAWDHCEFGLKPVDIDDSSDPKSLTVEFHWLNIPTQTDRVISMKTVPNLSAHHSAGRGNLKFLDCSTEQLIRSGDRITLTTPDSERFPLPSRELLTMRWHMSRIGALCGGAEGVQVLISDAYNDYYSDSFSESEYPRSDSPISESTLDEGAAPLQDVENTA